MIYDKIVLRNFVPYDVMAGKRLCVWDSKSTPDGTSYFSSEAMEEYEEAKEDLKRVLLEEHNKRVSFNNSADFQGFCVLEAMVRLSSPTTGYYYGSYGDLVEVCPFSYQTVTRAVTHLRVKGLVYEVGTLGKSKVFIVDEKA